MPEELFETETLLAIVEDAMANSVVQKEVSFLIVEEAIEPTECRICLEEEGDIRRLDSPCACSGSMKYVHRHCLQTWCLKKGDKTCELCGKEFGTGYEAPPPRKQGVPDFNGASLVVGPDPLNMEIDRGDEDQIRPEFDNAAARFRRDTLWSLWSASKLLVVSLMVVHILQRFFPSFLKELDAPTVFNKCVLVGFGFFISIAPSVPQLLREVKLLLDGQSNSRSEDGGSEMGDTSSILIRQRNSRSQTKGL